MKNLTLLLASAAILFGMAGCATTTDLPEAAIVPPIAQTQDARIADITARELDRRARYEPESLAAVAPQLRALALALAGPAPTDENASAAPEPLAAAPEDMLTAPSLLHGIHLASYRTLAHTSAGWDELRTRFPEQLAGREARVEAVTIPDRGDFLRLEAGPYDSLAAARAACAAIERAGEYCLPVDFSGRPLADLDPSMAH